MLSLKRSSCEEQQSLDNCSPLWKQHTEDSEEDELFVDCFEELPLKYETVTVDNSDIKGEEFVDCFDYFSSYDERIKEKLENNWMRSAQVHVTGKDKDVTDLDTKVCFKIEWEPKERNIRPKEANEKNGHGADDANEYADEKYSHTYISTSIDKSNLGQQTSSQCTGTEDYNNPKNNGISLAKINDSFLSIYCDLISFAKKIFALNTLLNDLNMQSGQQYDVSSTPKEENPDSMHCRTRTNEDSSKHNQLGKSKRQKANEGQETDRLRQSPLRHTMMKVKPCLDNPRTSKRESDMRSSREKEHLDMRGNLSWFSALLVVVCCLPVTQGMPTGSNVQWIPTSMPVVYGENITLVCTIGNEVISLSWHRGPHKLLAMENTTSDHRKFYANIKTVGNITQYNLTITNLNMSDMGMWYRCSNGNDWDQKVLNFSENEFVSRPSGKDIVKDISIMNKVKRVYMTIDNIFPLPVCKLNGKKLTTTMKQEKKLDGRFKITFSFDIQPCTENATFSCILANESVVYDAFNGMMTFECLPPSNHSDKQNTAGKWIVTGIITIAIVIVILAICCILKGNEDKDNYKDYQVQNINDGKTDKLITCVVESRCNPGHTQVTHLSGEGLL